MELQENAIQFVNLSNFVKEDLQSKTFCASRNTMKENWLLSGKISNPMQTNLEKSWQMVADFAFRFLFSVKTLSFVLESNYDVFSLSFNYLKVDAWINQLGKWQNGWEWESHQNRRTYLKKYRVHFRQFAIVVEDSGEVQWGSESAEGIRGPTRFLHVR